jgi:hypothetical protein
MKSKTQPMPIVCNMDVFTPLERENHIQMATQLFQSVQNIHEIENGYEFIFSNPSGSVTLTRMAEFISNERLCCPFLKFMVTIETDPQPISLILTGPEGTQEFLRAEFSEAFA